jgi:hypothetical protein
MVKVLHFDLAILILRPHSKHYFLHKPDLGLVPFIYCTVHKDWHVSENAHSVGLFVGVLVVELKLGSYHLFQRVVVEKDGAILHYSIQKFLLFLFNLIWLLL